MMLTLTSLPVAFLMSSLMASIPAAFADQKTGTGGEDAHRDLAGSAVDFDARNAGEKILFLHEVANLAIFNEEIGEILLGGVPTGVPIFDDANAEAVRINFLTHYSFPPYFA